MKPIIRRINDIDSLIDLLRFGNPIWKGATFQQIGFRGQAKASWNLTPKSFRRGVRLGYKGFIVSSPSPEIIEQTRAEYDAVRAFVELGDSVGLELPGDIGRFRNHRNRNGTDADEFWRKHWPDSEDHQLLAIAQHHGVPTRLLDFTHNPLIAAYFAASDCLKKLQSGERTAEFAIWAVDLRFFREIRYITNRQSADGYSSERLLEVLVPRHNNNFLRAQSGFFLIDQRANQDWSIKGGSSLNQVFIERTNRWRTRKGFWGATKISDFFLPYVKLRINSGIAESTLRFLHGEGINEASVFPSHDHIHLALEFMSIQGHPLE
ncbi:MAG: FRG domain-containing protein [Chloroflexi bacterium]|nr:FRG domain-containing protein [Chloroflexota bacterium]MDA1271608.1 FRG domain-containing protein [Chloroflexota bacterium]